MPTLARAITPCLWFDKEAEDAAKFYCSVFENSRITDITRYGNEGQDIHSGKPGAVMVVAFEINGQPFVALNGGPIFKPDEAVSFQVHCKTQAEIDYFWSKLTAGGGEEGPCGWVKDKFGFSWQVVPTALTEMLARGEPEKADRVTKAFLQMKKFDIAALERAYAGEAA